MTEKQVVIVGGGPAGLAAAVELKKRGVQELVVLEREAHLGGVLRQCIHDGFGLTRFGQSLSGPEYAARFLDEAMSLGVECVTGVTVLDITPDKAVTAVSPAGMQTYAAGAVVLAMGCRERTRGALSIPGGRPAGVYTAGVAQAYVNLRNLMPGKRAVILGSGDIGMIMARRLTLEGARVLGVYEILPHPSGLPRNIEQCLNDYDIPLYLSHTVTDIRGNGRLEAITVSAVDEGRRPIPGTERHIDCDTLILSVGLIPENELSLRAGIVLDPRTNGPVVDAFCQTTVSGVFAAGNVLQVHDLVDFVSLEAEHLAASVARYLRGGLPAASVEIRAEDPIGYTVPQRVSGGEDVTLSFRVKRPLPAGRVTVRQGARVLASRDCKRLIPAEMQRIVIPGAALAPETELKVVVDHV